MRLKDNILPIGERTCIMGVLNVTPDSFSDGGKYLDPLLAAEHAERMAEEGADIIDVGGESSRPGAEGISAAEELERIMPVLKTVAGRLKIPVSVDTRKSEVAREALRAGASVINDITALRGDPEMAAVIAEHGAGVVLMHMKGSPRDMQRDPAYKDVMGEIKAYLSGSIDIAHSAGIDPDKIIIDPGVGFGKTLEHNLEILRRLGELYDLGKPVLVGTSRKSFLGGITGKDGEARIFGTAASVAAAIMNGADVVRVHDVAAMKDIARVIDAIITGE